MANSRFSAALRRPTVTVLFLFCTLSAAAADSAVVLMYHRFGEERFPSTNVRREAFVAQLELLKESPYTVIGLPVLLDSLKSGSPLPDRSVVITIDDAYRSVHDVAWPLLREAGFPFTVFVATDPVDRAYGGIMSWEQMRAMAADGVTFASHGASHEHLVRREPGEDEAAWIDRVGADLDRGARRLREELGATGAVIDGAFAWPYGEFDEALAQLVASRGFVAFGQHSGAVGPRSDRRSLPRFPINEAYSDPDEFRVKVDSLPLPVQRVSPWDPVTDRRPTLKVWLAQEAATLTGLTCYVSGQGRVAPEWASENRFRITPPQPLGRGRQRVNCTAPGPEGRYYWFSHPWLVR